MMPAIVEALERAVARVRTAVLDAPPKLRCPIGKHLANTSRFTPGPSCTIVHGNQDACQPGAGFLLNIFLGGN
jgi:hypothetical protein